MDRQTRQAIKHDKFLDELNHAYTFAQRNRRILIIAAVVVAVIAVGAAFLAGYFRKQENAAQHLLADGIEIMQAQVGQTLPGTTTSYDSEETKQAAAEEIFLQVVNEYGGRDAADVAGIYLAQIEAGRGNYEAAQQRLETFIDDHPDHMLAGAAEMSLINIRLSAGQVDEVITDLQSRVAAEEGRVPRPALLALLAQAYEMKGDQDQAIDAYRRIANEFPDSPYSLDAQRKLTQS